MTMHVAPFPNSRPIHLGQAQTTIGFSQLPQMPAQAQPQKEPARGAPALSDRARSFGIAEVLSSPVQVESGTWGEAIAEALTRGLYGQAAARERQAGLDVETREQKLEDGQRQSYSDALRLSLDPSLQGADRTSAVAQALAGADPRAGFEYQQEQQPDPEAQRLEAIISTLPPDQQALARLNPQAYVTGIMRNRFPAPQRAGGNGVNSYTELPEGFELD